MKRLPAAPRVVAIVAMAGDGVIGRDNALPWRLPDDLRRFRTLTTGHAVLMGRRTWESIGRPLSGRQNLVLTRDPRWRAPGCESVHSPEQAIGRAAGRGTLFVIGGAEVYAACWPWVERVELTEVHAAVPGDVVLRGFARADWVETAREEHAADPRHAHPFSFVTLERAVSLPRPP